MLTPAHPSQVELVKDPLTHLDWVIRLATALKAKPAASNGEHWVGSC